MSPPLTVSEYLRRMRSSAVYNVAQRSALEFAPLLSQRTGHQIWLKREDQQPVFSFKLRGAFAMMARLAPEELARGVVAASAGNHAQGVGLAAQRLGTQATIVVPRTTPPIKVEAIRRFGVHLVLHGDTYDEAQEEARRIEREEGRVFVPPYDHPDVIAGNGTVGLEILEQHPGPIDAIFVPIGGGGLVAGIALAIKAIRPETRVIGVEPEDSDAMTRSIAEGRRVTLERVGLFADGVAVRTPGAETLRICQEFVDETVVVSNDAICAALKEIYEDRRAILEPSGALAYAGLRDWAADQTPSRSLIAIASGANLNFDRLRLIVDRAELGEHQEAILAVTIPERPGAFRQLCAALGSRMVTEFNYRMGDADQATVFVGARVANDEERRALIDGLNEAGYPCEDLSQSELAKRHLRHMVGGRCAIADHERVFSFEFPERVGALAEFLDRVGRKWNISLFHYRNEGSDRGQVLCGLQVPPATYLDFETFLAQVGYDATEQTASPALRRFLGG